MHREPGLDFVWRGVSFDWLVFRDFGTFVVDNGVSGVANWVRDLVVVSSLQATSHPPRTETMVDCLPCAASLLREGSGMSKVGVGDRFFVVMSVSGHPRVAMP